MLQGGASVDSAQVPDEIAENEDCPLPSDPVLAQAAVALEATGHWGMLADHRWNLVYVSDDLRLTFGGQLARVPVAIGSHFFGPRVVELALTHRSGPTIESWRSTFGGLGGWALADTAGGRERLSELVAPALRDLVPSLPDSAPETVKAFAVVGTHLPGRKVHVPIIASRLRAPDGRLAGTLTIHKPAPPTSVLAALSAGADPSHLRRMQRVAKAGRRSAAILFADLEASTPLTRRLPTAAYFSLGRRIVAAADQCVVDHGGIVGRHVGDGVVAFFLAEDAGSESAAARACLETARALGTTLGEVALRSDLEADELSLRFGLHWGATLYVGQILTSGRAEVTALGDAVNEAARIEACAAGGRTLASKELIERLDDGDAAALGLDTGRVAYTTLGELPGAPEKARRDAPALAVCEA